MAGKLTELQLKDHDHKAYINPDNIFFLERVDDQTTAIYNITGNMIHVAHPVEKVREWVEDAMR